MLILLLLLATIVSIALCRVIANKKGLSVRYWCTLAILFGPIALIAILFCKPHTELS
mgnify:CR=1 FL=1|jgi:hypothetical protein